MSSKKGIATLNAGIFYPKVLFCYKYEYDEILKELKKQKQFGWITAFECHKYLFEENARCFAAYSRIPDNKMEQGVLYYFIILRDEFKFKDIDYCKLAHECLHICQFILPDFLERDREIEAEAYLHTHLMTQGLE